ncbi:MAG: hypothetical protein AYW82_05090 [Bifidobacterium dentium]|nr:MAG: hypothetical protein AYW82_05090 [Bifidobacterium dentium]HBJ52448.1 hypothetical protein [Bifidobacterium dentium]
MVLRATDSKGSRTQKASHSGKDVFGSIVGSGNIDARNTPLGIARTNIPDILPGSRPFQLVLQTL